MKFEMARLLDNGNEVRPLACLLLLQVGRVCDPTCRLVKLTYTGRIITLKYRILGSTGLNVSVIGIGTWQFGGEWGQEYTPSDVAEIVAKGRDVGINLIDTAECYGDHLSEELIGKAIQSDRQNWIVASKFGHRFRGFMERDELWSKDDVLKQLEDSLRALRTDYIDIYQFHSGANSVFENDDLWAMLRSQVEAGKIRHLGLSIHRTPSAFQVEKSARDYRVQALQVIYNRLYRDPEQEIFPACEKYNVGVLARVALASGFLSGKYRPGADFQPSDVRATYSREEIDRQLREVEQIQQTEVPEGVPMAQWALAWCLRNPLVSCVIPGCRDAQQVESNARAADLLAG